MKRTSLLLLLLAVSSGQLVLADGTIELPAHARLQVVKIKAGPNFWKPIEVPKAKSRKVSLPPGEYSYVVSIKSATGNFSGELTVTDGSHQYIHRAVAPDEKSVFSWVSPNSPRSDEYAIETKEYFCLGVAGYGDKPQYMFDACAELAAANNPKGLQGSAYIYQNGLGDIEQDHDKASEYYLRAYKLGEQEAGAGYFLLHQDEPEGVEVLLELAEEGHPWSIGVAGQVMARSDDPEDQARGRRFAEQAVGLMDPAGFRVLAQLALAKGHGDVENVIEAAAWFNLYNIHNRERDLGTSRFKSYIEESLLVEDRPAIRRKTVGFASDKIQSGLFLLIDAALLVEKKDEGTLSLLINNEFAMPLSDFESRYSLELWPLESRYSVTLNADDAYLDSTTFLLGESEASVYCLNLNPDRGSLQVVTRAEDERCPATVDGTTTMWEVMNQYL